MTVNAAFNARTTNGASSGYELAEDTCVALLHNDSVMSGAEVSIEACSADTAGKYVPLDVIGTLTKPGVRTLTLKAGMFVRAVAAKGGSTMSLNFDFIT